MSMGVRSGAGGRAQVRQGREQGVPAVEVQGLHLPGQAVEGGPGLGPGVEATDPLPGPVQDEVVHPGREALGQEGEAAGALPAPEPVGQGQGQGQGNKDGARRPMRSALHGRLVHRMSELLYLEPSFLFQTTGGAMEFGVQALAGLKINNDFTLRAGPGLRLGDAAQIMIGGDYQDLRVGLSYDLNISPLSEVSNFQGGFELAAQYIIKIYKKPKISPAILCPQL